MQPQIQINLDGARHAGPDLIIMLLSIPVNVYYHTINPRHQFLLEMIPIKQNCNITGWEHFGLYIENNNFSGHCFYI